MEHTMSDVSRALLHEYFTLLDSCHSSTCRCKECMAKADRIGELDAILREAAGVKK